MKIIRLISYFFILNLLIFSFSLPVKAVEYQYDLGFNNNSDIWLSETILFIGNSVRLYAKVHNFGLADDSGYVTFYNGTTLIGDSQVVTVLPGSTDDVWVDFVVPETDFNILARIMGTNPADENLTNNETVTATYYPQQDSNNNGVPDSQEQINNNVNLNNEGEQLMTNEEGQPEANLLNEEETNQGRDIFAPINFYQSNLSPSKQALEFINLNTDQNINPNPNFNLDLNGYLNLSKEFNNKNQIPTENFFSLSNIWFDLIIALVVLIILAITFLIIKAQKVEDQIFNLPLTKKTLAEKSPPDELDMFEVKEEVPVKKEVYKKIKVKKIASQKSKKLTIND